MKLWTVQYDVTIWCATQREAHAEKRRLTQTGIKRNEITVQSVEVPTKRGELASWLNDREVRG